MKLVCRVLLHMSWSLSLLLAVWAVLFYLAMIDEINDEVDDSLENYSEMLVRQSLAGRELPGAYSGSNNGYFLHDVTAEYAASHPDMVYTDEDVFIPDRDEVEPARVLRSVFRDRKGHYRELTVMTPTIEKDDLQEKILWGVVWLYLFLLLTILLVNVWVLHRMLRPLYALLRWLDGYVVGGKNPPLAVDTKITEFRRLNEAACRYADRAELLFERQKQFIGNASHEMQTPLAVCRNRLEMLVDDGSEFTEEQLGELLKVQRSLDSLVRLNKSLLLLSKIENGQFPEAEEVDFNDLVRHAAAESREVYAHRQMRFELREEGRLKFRMNPALAGSMVTNLLKNAYVHGGRGGRILVTITPGQLRIANSAAEGALDGNRLFERFYQGAKREGSTGLGLSVVESICRHYGLKINYSYEDKCHRFTVRFPV